MPTHINKAKCWNKCQTLHYREILALPTRPSFDVSRAPVRRVRIVSDQFVLRHVLHQTECPHTHTWTSSKPHMQSLSQLSPPNQTECLANTHYTVTHMNSLQFFWNYPELSIQFKLYFWILSVSVSVLNLLWSRFWTSKTSVVCKQSLNGMLTVTGHFINNRTQSLTAFARSSVVTMLCSPCLDVHERAVVSFDRKGHAQHGITRLYYAQCTSDDRQLLSGRQLAAHRGCQTIFYQASGLVEEFVHSIGKAIVLMSSNGSGRQITSATASQDRRHWSQHDRVVINRQWLQTTAMSHIGDGIASRGLSIKWQLRQSTHNNII